MMTRQGRKRGVVGPIVLVVAGLAGLLVGISLAVGMGITAVGSMVPEERTAVPGSVIVDVEPQGTVYVFAESRSEIGGRPVSGPVPIPGLVLTASDANGDPLMVETPRSVSSTYSMPTYEGDLVAIVPMRGGRGPARVDASLSGPAPAGTPVIAVKRADLGGMAVGIIGLLGGMLVFLVGLGMGVGGLIWLIVRLSKRGGG